MTRTIVFTVLLAAACGESTPPPAEPDLSGRYAAVLRTDRVTRNTTTSEETFGQTTMWGIVDLDQSGSAVTATLRPCRLVVPPVVSPLTGTAYMPTIADATLQSISEPIVVDGTFDAATGTLETGYGAFILGAAGLADPVAEPLPFEESDPRVIDQDGDGNPAVTFALVPDSGPSIGALYVAQRMSASVSGRANAAGDVVGTMDLTLDIVVYGDDIPVIDARMIAIEEASVTETVSEDHVFRIVRAAATTECDAVLAMSLEP